MKLIDYGLDGAEARAEDQVQAWQGRTAPDTGMGEALVISAAVVSWEQVRRAARASRAMRPGTVFAAGEVATHQMHELERLRGQGEAPVETLNQAILAAEEAGTLIAEILANTEGDTP